MAVLVRELCRQAAAQLQAAAQWSLTPTYAFVAPAAARPVVKSRKRRVVSARHGVFEAVEAVRAGPPGPASQPQGSPELARLVPRRSAYAFDVMAQVGVQTFLDGHTLAQVQQTLRSQSPGVEIPLSTLQDLKMKFLWCLGRVHQQAAPQIKDYLRQRGHIQWAIDGTLAPGTPVFFGVKEPESGWLLACRKIPPENRADIDGHVRVYHGKHRLPKAHVARMRLSMPATSDYWVNDTAGDPWFVVTAEANAGLVKMLPLILQEVRTLVGPRRLTFVFDRGGFSPKLFQEILAAGFDLLTYRKGRHPRIARKRFQTCQTRVDGHTFSYVLADQEVRLLKGKLRLRQVTRLAEDGHQTPILTSRRDLSAAQVAYRMFERWRQENYFKCLREEYALDALAEYAAEPDDPAREVLNPAWARVDTQLRQAWAQLDRLQAEYGLEALTNPEKQRPTMRGFKVAQGKLSAKIAQALQRVEQLQARRDAMPRRVPVQATTQEPIVKLAPERKHLTNLVKMVAYQAESDLFRLIAPHYPRAQDEGRTLILSALASAADLEVTDKELRVTLAPLSSPHRTRAIAALCEELNATQTVFPGSRLRLRYAIREVS